MRHMLMQISPLGQGAGFNVRVVGAYSCCQRSREHAGALHYDGHFRLATLYRSMSLIFLATPFRWRPLSFQKDFHWKEKDSARVDVAGEPKPIATACSHQQNVQCRCFVTSNTILPILGLFRH